MRKNLVLSVVLGSALAFTCGAFFTGCTKSKPDVPNTVYHPLVMKVKGLDPAYADDEYSGISVAMAYDTLLEFHYLKRPYVLEASLAEKMPELSADGRTYTFKLRKGTLFQDDPCFKESGGKGRELVAEDVVYSFKRIADPKTASGGWWIFDGKVVGLNEWREQASKSGTSDYSLPVEGLKAIDRYTVQIKLSHRNAQFLFNLTQPFASVLPHEAIEAYGKDMLLHPVGTGPFHLAEYVAGSKYTWVRNATYRKDLYPSEGEAGDREAGLLADAGQPLPRADRVIIQAYEETQPRWLNFMAGKLDVSTVPKDNFGQVITPSKDLAPELKAKGMKLHPQPRLDITHETFNMADPLLGKNKLLRQALSLAFDPKELIDLFYFGLATPAQGPIPPGVAGYDEKFKNPYRQFNVAKAKELLAKAGYPDGKGLPPIEYLAGADSTSRQITEYLAKSFAAIGVKLKVNSMSWPEFQASIKNKKGQMWGYAWSGDYPDAENFLQLFYSKNASPGSNDANYSNPEFDRLYEKSLTLVDSPERTELYQQMARIVAEDAPWIFGVHRMTYSVTQGRLKNYKSHDYDHGRLKYYRIEAERK